MAFTSLKFLVFISLVFIVYYAVPLQMRWISLLLFSFAFYAYADIRYVVFLVFTIITTYLIGRVLQHYNNECKEALRGTEKTEKKAVKNNYKAKKQKVLLVGILINLLVLIIVKYTNDFIANINVLGAALKVDIILNPISILVPLGISYYVFQSIGYVVDIYREKYDAEKNIFKYALFLSFFPQLIQGPISRYDILNEQLIVGHPFEATQVQKGLLKILWGFFLKLVIADRIGIMTNTIFNNFPQYLGSYVILGGAFIFHPSIYRFFWRNRYCERSGRNPWYLLTRQFPTSLFCDKFAGVLETMAYFS